MKVRASKVLTSISKGNGVILGNGWFYKVSNTVPSRLRKIFFNLLTNNPSDIGKFVYTKLQRIKGGKK